MASNEHNHNRGMPDDEPRAGDVLAEFFLSMGFKRIGVHRDGAWVYAPDEPDGPDGPGGTEE